MATVLGRGRTGIVYRVEYGLVCKVRHRPNSQSLDAEFKNAFAVEEQLLKRLGVHPGIVRYRGLSEAEGMKDGLLLDEANCGTLQSYIDGDSKIDDALRRKWSLQIAKALAYVHEKGIIHSNLSTTNVLVHQTGQTLDLLLADFGGSRCLELDLDGNLLPDHAYLDPQATAADFQSPKLDVFSLGIVLYIIITGHYPFYQSPAPQDEERVTYGDRVRALYKEGKFPNLSGVLFGGVIAGCCCERRFETAREVVIALEAEMQHVRKPTLLPFILKLIWRRGTSLGAHRHSYRSTAVFDAISSPPWSDCVSAAPSACGRHPTQPLWIQSRKGMVGGLLGVYLATKIIRHNSLCLIWNIAAWQNIQNASDTR